MLEQPAHRSLDRLIQAGIAPRRARRILREFSESAEPLRLALLGSAASRRGLCPHARALVRACVCHVSFRNGRAGQLAQGPRRFVEQRLCTDTLDQRIRTGLFALGTAACRVTHAGCRSGPPPRESVWPYIGILMTCVVGALTNFSVDMPPLAQAPSMTAGIGISTDHIGAPLLRAVGTAALALLPYIRVRYLQRREVDAL